MERKVYSDLYLRKVGTRKSRALVGKTWGNGHGWDMIQALQPQTLTALAPCWLFPRVRLAAVTQTLAEGILLVLS